MAIMNNTNDSNPYDELNIDITTGVFNENYMDNLLKDKFPNMWLCTLLLIQIDELITDKDYYDKNENDKVLKEVSKIIFQSVGELGTIGRYSENEFIVVLPLISKRAAFILAEKIKKMIHIGPIFSKGERQYINIYIGACTFLKDENIFCDLEQWIKATENALYQAKVKGKNIVVQV